MIDFLLRCAAKRWHDDGQMLAEWRAELYTMDSTRHRMWYALSLATSRPHHITALPLPRTIPSIVTSLLLLLALPIAYPLVAVRWFDYSGPDPVLWRSWVIAASAAGAVLLGTLVARLTAGLTNVIKPVLLSTWVFGVPFALYASLSPPWAYWWRFLALALWLAGGVVGGIVVVRLTQRGRTAMAWLSMAIAAPVVHVLSSLGLIYFLTDRAMGPSDPSDLVSIALGLTTQPLLYVTLFGLVYTRGLAAAKYR